MWLYVCITSSLKLNKNLLIRNDQTLHINYSENMSDKNTDLKNLSIKYIEIIDDYIIHLFCLATHTSIKYRINLYR